MATELYLVRHGHTKANRPFFLCGRLEYPLDDLGINQAQIARTTISRLHFDAVYCSPAKRARETARIATSGLPMPAIQYDERLLERAYGNYEGSWGPLTTLRLWSYEKSYTKISSRGEESILGLEIRVREFLDEIRDRHPDQTVLAFTHSGVITMVDTIIEDRHHSGNFFRHFHINNGAITMFTL